MKNAQTTMMTMMMTMSLLAGCGGQTQMMQPPGESQFVAGFNPAAVKEGYTRFVSPKVPGISAGADVEYCQWVAASPDHDEDVISIIGQQSKGGHHAVLYASTNTTFPVGESHVCTEDDMVSFSFLGAVGGEGMATDITGLPAGLNFRLRKGNALVINTHFVNASPSAIDGQAVIDVKFAAASPDHMVADLFANNGALFEVAAGQTASYDVNCVLQKDLNFAMVTNHMHGHGIAALSEIIHADGTREMMVKDDTWAADQKFNPRYERFSVAAPKTAKKGDTYHTRCTWTNSESKALHFPTEMCAGVGFYFPGTGSIACSDGGWGGR